MTKIKRIKGQTVIYKTLNIYRKLVYNETSGPMITNKDEHSTMIL